MAIPLFTDSLWGQNPSRKGEKSMADVGMFAAEPVLTVPDVKQAAEYYRDILGFEITLIWGDPPTHAVVRRGVSIQFDNRHTNEPNPSGWTYIRLSQDLDGLYEEYKSSGANIAAEIEERPWGKREFDIEDLNGYRIRFSVDA